MSWFRGVWYQKTLERDAQCRVCFEELPRGTRCCALRTYSAGKTQQLCFHEHCLPVFPLPEDPDL
jgi:hypothetical protein